MGLNKIEHLGIAVEDAAKASQLFETLLGTAPYKEEAVAREGVTTVFFRLGESKVELLESTREDSAIGKFISKRGPGLHHVAFQVADIEAELARLREAGFQILNPEPQPGADGMRIAFLHPKTTGGLLVELCEPTAGTDAPPE